MMHGFLTRMGMVLLVCATGIPVQAEPIEGIASVVDGDTLKIHGTGIRLHGVDAPESGQSCRAADGKSWRCGQRAALALSDRLGRKRVTCTELDKDRYGRIVSVCRADVPISTNGWSREVMRWLIVATQRTMSQPKTQPCSGYRYLARGIHCTLGLAQRRAPAHGGAVCGQQWRLPDQGKHQ